MTSRPSPGIYDRLLDQDLAELLARYPELRPLFGKLEAEDRGASFQGYQSLCAFDYLPENRKRVFSHYQNNG